MTDGLKPVRCGCGGEAILDCYLGDLHKSNLYYICCAKCDIRTSNYLSEAEVVEAWNKAIGATDKNVGDKFDKDTNVLCKERTAKVKDLDRRSETPMCWEGICTKCGAYTMHEMNYCFHCGVRLEWE